ncbi:MAG: hypothetical protein HYU99_11290 [Deltaproteobacteria bacterium]|nr:hypothetical protein [Deltaproteobacteria bacterium]
MQHQPTKDTNTIEHIWTRIDYSWLFAGALSGASAGLLVILVAAFGTAKIMGDWTQPFKLVGAAVFGAEATAYGPLGKAGQLGLFIHMTLSIIYGTVFAHLVHEKSRPASLIVLGFVTGFIIWVFSCKLFLPSFDITLATRFPSTLSLLLQVLFGVSNSIFLVLFRPYLLKGK